MKAQEIYNDVNFDYPTCGGYIITTGRKYLTIERLSNYQGNRSGCKARVELGSKTAAAIINELDNNELDTEYLCSLEYFGGYTVQ